MKHILSTPMHITDNKENINMYVMVHVGNSGNAPFPYTVKSNNTLYCNTNTLIIKNAVLIIFYQNTCFYMLEKKSMNELIVCL